MGFVRLTHNKEELGKETSTLILKCIFLKKVLSRLDFTIVPITPVPLEGDESKMIHRSVEEKTIDKFNKLSTFSMSMSTPPY